jgi:AcrR family transcriptional regulator
MAGLAVERDQEATLDARAPRTERGRRTLRAILDAAATEFGTRGFHDTSIVAITQAAGVALGSFYTYFESKEALFRALVTDMSARVGAVGAAAVEGQVDMLSGERAVVHDFMAFARGHKELYRIIDEAEFVDPESWRAHYEGAAARIGARLSEGAARGELRPGVGEVEAWAMMGMNVFLGLRYGVMADDADLGAIADAANALIGRDDFLARSVKTG